MNTSLITQFYAMTWTQILLFIPVVTLICSAFECCVRQHRKTRYLIYLLLLAVWLIVLLHCTLLFRENCGKRQFAPLFESYRVARTIQPELYRANIMNVLLFFPGGMAFAAILPRTLRWWRLAITGFTLFLVSGGVELIQYYTALGVAEADDVLHNTMGALFGGISMISATYVGGILRR